MAGEGVRSKLKELTAEQARTLVYAMDDLSQAEAGRDEAAKVEAREALLAVLNELDVTLEEWAVFWLDGLKRLEADLSADD